MTRCIHCTRCVRFGEEVSGMQELGATGRSEHMEIGTFIERNMDSELSGNVIDLCPVGALTSKPFRFQARSWELTQIASIATHDCVGSNIYIHSQRGKAMRVVPKDNEEINETWLADRDRFSYEAINSDQRLTTPLIKTDGQWEPASWEVALNVINTKLKAIIQDDGAEMLGALISPSATVEEQYLLQKYLRALGSNNIDHRLLQLDFRNQAQAPLFPNLGIKIAELEQQDMVLLVGSNVHQQQPIIGLKLRKLVKNGGNVCVINPVDWQCNFMVSFKQIPAHGDLMAPLAGIAKALLEHIDNASDDIPAGAYSLLLAVTPGKVDQEMAAAILAAPKKLILLGDFALNHPQASGIIALVNLIHKITKAKFGVLSAGANSAGAWLTGCVPHRLPGGQALLDGEGRTALEMLEQPLSAYILSGIEPEFDTALGAQVLQTLAQAKFVVAVTSFKCKSLLATASVLLPATLAAEMAGTLVNVEGRWQDFRAAVKADDAVKPAWKIWHVLGVIAELPGFNYNSAPEIAMEVKALVGLEYKFKAWDWWCPKNLNLNEENKLTWVGSVPIYGVDYMVRRASSLQQTNAARAPEAQVNSKLAAKFGITDGQYATVKTKLGAVKLLLKLNTAVPDQTICIAYNTPETIALGRAYVEVGFSND